MSDIEKRVQELIRDALDHRPEDPDDISDPLDFLARQLAGAEKSLLAKCKQLRLHLKHEGEANAEQDRKINERIGKAIPDLGITLEGHPAEQNVGTALAWMRGKIAEAEKKSAKSKRMRDDEYQMFNDEIDRLKEEHKDVIAKAIANIEETGDATCGPDDVFPLARRLAEAEATIQDYKDSARIVLEDKCANDEVHCACVPILRAELAEADKDLKAYEGLGTGGGKYHAVTELRKERDEAQAQLADMERGEEKTMLERDDFEEAIQNIHVALGGDGEWVSKMPAGLPPHSGDLCADALCLAEELRAKEEAKLAALAPFAPFAPFAQGCEVRWCVYDELWTRFHTFADKESAEKGHIGMMANSLCQRPNLLSVVPIIVLGAGRVREAWECPECKKSSPDKYFSCGCDADCIDADIEMRSVWIIERKEQSDDN